jgi:hypothetical protein
MSFLVEAAVIVGATAFGHLKLAGQVTDLAVPSAVKINTNELVRPVNCMLVMVKVVIFAFNDTSNTVALFKSIASVPADIAGAVRTDDALFGRNTLLSSTTVVPVIFSAIFAPYNL